MKKIILTGGGTAGHVMPNIALLHYLDGYEIHYIGGNGMEKEILKRYKDVIYHEIPCVKYARGLKPKNLLIPFKLLRSICAARKIIGKIEPQVIFSKGGYVSLPVALSAGKIPLITHESDMSMGLTNKIIRRKCRYVCTSFDVTAKTIPNGIATGAILRRELYTGKRTSPYPTLLIMGGSLGSAAINDCVTSCINSLTARYNVIHIVGKGNSSGSAPRYRRLEFSDSIADLYADADLIVSRGGANSLFEIAALNKKALIIPLPKGASRGDQVENADYFEKKGVVKVLRQSELSGPRLMEELIALENFSPARFTADGTKKVARIIKETAEQRPLQ